MGCIHSSSKNKSSHTIIGGASQGGAVAWTAAEKYFKSYLSEQLTFILANTWLPIDIIDTLDNSTSHRNNLHIIYNTYDDIVLPSLVEKSIKNSGLLHNENQIRKL